MPDEFCRRMARECRENWLPPDEGEKPYGCYDLVGFLQDVVKSWGPSPAYEIEALGHGYGEGQR